MNENFEKEINEIEENITEPSVEEVKEEAPAEEKANESEIQPNTQPQNFTPPTYQNQYMPYGNYAPVIKPEAKKEASKGKKKGIIIAAIILCVSFLIAIVALFVALFSDGIGNDKDVTPETNSDDTQMDFAETPNNVESILSDGNELSAKDVYNKVHESSVGILVYSGNKQQVSSEGTGVVMGTNGEETGSYIITCAHVVDVSNPKILVQTTDGTQYDATIVGTDSKTDIGVLFVASTDLKAAEFADSNSLQVGETVYAIGNPGGTQFFGSFTNGMVSAIGRPVDSPVGYEVACIQHTAAINPGNSGGALVNGYGQIVGINSSKIASTDYEGMGFAVPSSTVKEVVDQLISNGRVTNRPALGIQFMPATQSQTYTIIVKTNNLPAGSIVIDTIMSGSDLENKGVKEGDMIIGVDGEELDDYDIILEKIENGKVGDELTLTICQIDSDYKISTFDVKVKLVEDSSISEPEEAYETQTFPFPFGE